MKRSKEHNETNLQHSRDGIRNLQICCINSSNAKNTLQCLPKSPSLSLLFVIYLYKICLSVQKREITPSVRIHFQKVSGACFCLDLMHMIHLWKKWNTSCEGFAWQLGGEKSLHFTYSIFKKCQVLVLAWIQCTWYTCPQTGIQAVKARLDNWLQQNSTLGLTMEVYHPCVHQRYQGRWVVC